MIIKTIKTVNFTGTMVLRAQLRHVKQFSTKQWLYQLILELSVGNMIICKRGTTLIVLMSDNAASTDWLVSMVKRLDWRNTKMATPSNGRSMRLLNPIMRSHSCNNCSVAR